VGEGREEGEGGRVMKRKDRRFRRMHASGKESRVGDNVADRIKKKKKKKKKKEKRKREREREIE